MTTPAKAVGNPKKDATKTPSKRTQTADFDFSGLQVTDTDAPTRSGSREAAPNPFIDHMRASADKRTDRGKGTWIGQGKTVTVPKAQAKTVVNLIRYAANRLNIGSAINETELAGGKVRIDFAAKNRKQKRTAASNGI